MAVIVRVKLPTLVVELVVTVRVDVPVAGSVIDVGLKDPVAPAGAPVTARPTVPPNPLSGVTVTVYVVLLPRTTTCLVGAALTEKSGVALTVM